MAALLSAKVQSSCQGDPERDLVIHRLIEVAREILDEYFSRNDRQSDYQKQMQGKKNSKKAATSKLKFLDRWLAGDAALLELLAQPEKERFVIRVEGEKFKTEVSVAYEPELGDLIAAWVIFFEGNAEAFLAAASTFNYRLLDGLRDLDPKLNDIGINPVLPTKNKSQFPATKWDGAVEPTEVTDQDIEWVIQLTTTVAAGLNQGELMMPEPRAQVYLGAKPQFLWTILEGFLTACDPIEAEEQDENLKAAYQILLVNQLELIRYRSERGWAWADEMLADYQRLVIELAKGGKLSIENLFAFTAALTEAKIPLNPRVRDAFLQSEPHPLALSSLQPESGAEVIRSEVNHLIIKLAEVTDNPFRIVEGLKDAAKLMPSGVQAFLVHECALSSHLVLRDAVPLMLLDPDAEVRQAASAALEQMAAPDSLSPVALRRAIILRNWIPEDERAGVDRAIKKGKTKGVACANWIAPPQLSILGMPVDGSGAHGLIFTTKASTTGLFGGILCKQNFGLRDIWCDAEKPRHVINQAVSSVRDELASIEVEKDYVDTIVQHYLGMGLANARLPTPDLLAIAEVIGAAGWRAAQLETDMEIDRLVSELSLEEISPESVSTSLQRSGQWLKNQLFAKSWFQADAEVASVVLGASKLKGDADLKAIFELILEKRRGLWAEKFFLMALWSRAAKAQADEKYWPDFLILSRELSAGRPLTEIPIMTAIAQSSLKAVKSNGGF